MTRRILLTLSVLAALVTAVGCARHDELTVRGTVVADAAGASTGFSFPMDTRIDAPDGSSLGLITGSCEMGRLAGADGSEQWGVVVEIRRSSTVDDLGLESITIMQRTDAEPTEGRVEAQLGPTAYASRAGGSCSVELPYAIEDGMVGITGSCDVYDAENNVATVAIELDLVGCTVVR